MDRQVGVSNTVCDHAKILELIAEMRRDINYIRKLIENINNSRCLTEKN